MESCCDFESIKRENISFLNDIFKKELETHKEYTNEYNENHLEILIKKNEELKLELAVLKSKTQKLTNLSNISTD